MADNKNKVIVEAEAKEFEDVIQKSEKLDKSLKKTKKSAKSFSSQASEMGQAFGTASTSAGTLLSRLGALAKHPIIAIIVALIAAFKFLTASMKTNTEGATMLAESWGTIKGVLEAIMKIVGEGLVKSIKEAGGVVEWLKGLWDSTVNAMLNGIKKVSAWFKKMGKIFREDGVGAALKEMKEDASEAWDKATEGATKAWEQAKKFTKQVVASGVEIGKLAAAV